MEGPLAWDRHQVVWDGLDDGGRSVASGVYVVKLSAGDVVDVHKVVVMR